MPRNGSGTMTRVHDWTTDADNNIDIEASRMDEDTDDIADEITNSLAKDGQTTPTANLPMGGFLHTSVGNATARNQYAAVGQIQDQSFTWCGTAGGTANALTLTPAPAITAYATGQSFLFKAGASPNSGATTIAISGLSTIAAQYNGAACIGGEILANKWYRITLDSTSSCQLEAISTQVPFIDSIPIIRGSSDNTKQFAIEVDGFTTATTRTMTPADISFSAGGIVSAQHSGDTNDSSSGSGADFNHNKTYTVPASHLTAGKMLRVTAHFDMRTGSSGPNLLLGLKAGSTDLARSTAASTGNNLTRQFTYVWDIMGTAAAGASANVEISAAAGFQNSSVASSTAQPVALATNGTLVLTPFTQWATAGTGTNTIRLATFVVEALN